MAIFNKLSGREQALSMVSIVMVVILVCYFFMLRPKINRLTTLNAKIERAQQDHEEQLKRGGVKDLPTLLADYKVFGSGEAVNFLTILMKMAEETGNKLVSVKVKSFKPVSPVATPVAAGAGGEKAVGAGGEKAAAELYEYIMDITVQGRYFTVVAFLERLENYKRLINVSKPRMQRLQVGEELLEVSFLLTLYVLDTGGYKLADKLVEIEETQGVMVPKVAGADPFTPLVRDTVARVAPGAEVAPGGAKGLWEALPEVPTAPVPPLPTASVSPPPMAPIESGAAEGVGGMEEVKESAPLILMGVVYGKEPIAVIARGGESYVVKVGDVIEDGLVVKRIGPKGVILFGKGKRLALEIKK